MRTLETAQQRLQWCMHQEQLTLRANVDGTNESEEAYEISFYQADRVVRVFVPYDWLDDCSPETQVVTGSMHHLLMAVRAKFSFSS
jgi:hypothetical protein